jgi:hypothetical protein
MKVQVNFKETNYGWVEVEVDETNPNYEDDIYEKAWDKITEGDVRWGKTDSDITNWEKI